MEVRLLAFTKLADSSLIIPGETECDSLVMRAIAQCYQTKPSPRALRTCLLEGHHSVFEHLSFTFAVSDISRTCLAQLTRHRLASYTVESQRYNDYTKKPYRYIVPETIAQDKMSHKMFLKQIEQAKQVYDQLRKRNVPAQDARFVLSEATGVNLTFTMNARELMHVFDLRLSSFAQWEIRNLFYEVLKIVKPLAPRVFAPYPKK